MIVISLTTVFIAATALGLILVSINVRGLRNYFDSRLKQLEWSMSTRISLQRADLNFTYAEYAFITAAIGIGAFLITILISHSAIFSIGIAMAAMFIPRLHVNQRINNRRKEFTNHFSNTLRFMGSSLKTGTSITESISLVSQFQPAPICDEFAKLHTAIVHSGNFEDCLNDLYQRMPTEEVDKFVTTIGLGMRTGGALSEILQGLADEIDKRIQVEGEIKSKVAPGRMEAMILVAMPAVLFFALYGLKPDFMQPALANAVSQKLLIGALFWQIVGAVLTHKIINIRI